MAGVDVARPVVAGVERGEAGRAAVLWAADEAVRRGRGLRLVRALEWPAGAPHPEHAPAAGASPRHREAHHVHATAWPTEVYHDADLLPPARGWGDKFRDAGAAVLAEARDAVAARYPGLAIELGLVDGTPTEVLRAETASAALVVLGSRHLSAITELLTTGGIAVPVAAHATCPVAIVRGPEHDAALARSVVVGVDGSARSEPAIGYAFDEASRRGAVLTAILAAHGAGPHGTAHALDDGAIRLSESLAGWKTKYPDVVVRPQAVQGHAVKVLADASEHAMCLVVGGRGMGGFRGMLLGSVSQNLIHHAKCPLVVVPDAADS